MGLGSSGLSGSSGAGGGGVTVYAYDDIAALYADGSNRTNGDLWAIPGSGLAGTFQSSAPLVHPLEMGWVPTRYIGASAANGYELSGDATVDGNGDLVVAVNTDSGANVAHYLPSLDANSSEVILNIPGLDHPVFFGARVSLSISAGTVVRFGMIVYDEGGNGPHCGVAGYDGQPYIYKVTGPAATGYISQDIGSVTIADSGEYFLGVTLARKTTGAGEYFGQMGTWGAAHDSGFSTHNMDAAAANAWSLRIWASGSASSDYDLTVKEVTVKDPTGEAQA